MGVGVKFNIPLMVWGESIAEVGRADYSQPIKFDRDYFTRVSAKLYPKEMLNKERTIPTNSRVLLKCK